MGEEDDERGEEAWERRKALFRATSPEFRLTELIEKLSERVATSEEESRRRDEKNQRNIDFILRQQAQFAADMQQMREAQAGADERWERRWGRTEESIRALLIIAEIHEREITALAEAQERTAKAQEDAAKAQAEAQARTGRQIAKTGERLNALIGVVERMISERRNGGAGDGQKEAG